MNVLYLASEATPFNKVGGLADVAGELPRALRKLGVDIRLALPFYPEIKKAYPKVRKVGEVDLHRVSGTEAGEIYILEEGTIPVYLIDGELIRQSEEVYGNPELDAQKFIFFSLASLAACRKLGWRPTLIHANDWHTAISVVWIRAHRQEDDFWATVATVITVHNLPYMGAGSEITLAEFGFIPSTNELLPDWARFMPLPMGLEAADWLTTVSPSYALEIQTPTFGHGLERILSSRRERLVGILNGIDPSIWDPVLDTALPSPFSRDNLYLRQANKSALQKLLDLPPESRVPLLGMVSRLDYQKGIDLAIEALTNLMDEDWQFVLLGTGDLSLEKKSWDFAATYPERIRVVHRFDSDLARLIYGGCDLLLIPSRYEPCGLAQMIAMRYGNIPVVRATGGLKDTVVDYDRGKQSTGFVFSPEDAGEFGDTLRRGFVVYADKRRWQALQRRAMAKDFSWNHAAESYWELYKTAIHERVGNG